MTAERQTYSRYQVLCAEREAWNDGEDAGDETYYYDGISFWRCEAGARKRLLPSWRTPGARLAPRGRLHCDLCAAHRPAAHPLSVA